MAELPHDVILKIVHDTSCDSSVAATATSDMAVGIFWMLLAGATLTDLLTQLVNNSS